MVLPDSAQTPERPRSVCLVVSDPGASAELARLLLGRGAAAHVLHCPGGRTGDIAAAARRCREVGATFSTLEAREIQVSFRVRNIWKSSRIDRGDEIRHALERLQSERRFDLIAFAAAGGLGFRTIQAKRAGLGFGQTRLAVRLDSCGAWRRDQDCRWPSTLEELDVDFAERYAFENADFRVSLSPDVLDFVRRIGWADRGDVNVGSDDRWLAQVYDDLIRDPNAKTALDAGGATPLVTVAVPHYNLGAYLPETLASLAAQTYPRLEVVVIDDGSTDPRALEVFGQMQSLYPGYRFLRQTNAGIGATRNRGLREASGEYFLPMDADNVARPDMVERFAAGLRRNPDLSAMTCYFLAFKDGVSPTRGPYLYAYRPTGGPHALACIRNVYGDGNAIFRTADFRAVGGYETDRDASFEDWEAFVKLVNAGRGVGVVPDHLFYYRHREEGFSRVTDDYRNRRRVLRQFLQLDRLSLAERAVLWPALLGFQRRADQVQELLRYRMADSLHALCGRVPFVTRGLKWFISLIRP